MEAEDDCLFQVDVAAVCSPSAQLVLGHELGCVGPLGSRFPSAPRLPAETVQITWALECQAADRGSGQCEDKLRTLCAASALNC